MLSRRQFLAAAGGVVAAGAAGSATWAALTNLGERGSSGAHPVLTPTSSAAPTGSATTAAGTADRVLVVVQLQGGNDGLNTLVPLDGRYHDARPSLAIPADDKLVKFPGTEAFGLHPALAPLTGLLTAGHVAAFESIGYQHPDRSHFAALDAWWSGTPGQASSTGWLGRYLDMAVPSAAGGEPLLAVALGGGTPAFAADHVTPTVVFSPAAFRLQAPRGVNRAALIDGWKSSGGAPAVAAADAVTVFEGLGVGATPAGAGETASSLDVAARLIAAGHGTRIIYVNSTGFDTHAGQAATQERLLADLANGVSGFYSTLASQHLDDRVLLITVSEFGRRVAENGSGGTDHGKAGVQFLVGPMVKGGVYGDLDLAHLDDGDVAAHIDTRSLYSAALGWLGAPADEVLGGHFDPLGTVTK